MSNIQIKDADGLSSMPQFTFQELGTGVFEKPSKLCDLLFVSEGKRKIVACDNASDIRFVESVAKRKGLPIRRVSPLVNPTELNSVASFLQGKQEDFTLVCPTPILLSLIEKHPPECIILYSPNPSEEIVRYLDGNPSTKLVALASPAELSGFLTKCQSVNKVFSPITLDESFVSNSVLRVLKEKLSKVKSQSGSTTSSVTKSLLGNASESGEIIEKLVAFFLENIAGPVGEAIDEELGIAKEEHRDREGSEGSSRERSSQGRRERAPREDRQQNFDRRDNSRDRDQGRDRNHNRNAPRDDNRDRREDREGAEGQKREPRVKRMRYRFYVGLGENHELGIQSMRDLLSDVIGEECRIQRVHLRDQYSFVDMESADLDALLQSVSHVRYQGKLVHLDLAEEMGESFPYRGGHQNRGRGGYNNNRRRNYSR